MKGLESCRGEEGFTLRCVFKGRTQARKDFPQANPSAGVGGSGGGRHFQRYSHGPSRVQVFLAPVLCPTVFFKPFDHDSQ